MIRELSREHGRLSRYYRCRRAPPTVLQPIGRTEPDLDLIKQVEQVTTFVLEGPAPALCQDSEHRDHEGARDPRISIFAIIGLADISLQKTAKTARSGRGRTVPERSSGMLPAARVIPRTEPLGLSTCCAANFGETATLPLARRCSMPRLIAAMMGRWRHPARITSGRTAMEPLRSFLFAPGNHARRVEKALSLDADAVILDLEDAVAALGGQKSRR